MKFPKIPKPSRRSQPEERKTRFPIPPHRERVLHLDADKQSILKQGKTRAVWIGRLVGIMVVLIIVRIGYLQLVDGAQNARNAMDQITGEHTEVTPRGSIVDRNGEELAVSVISKSLYVNPQEMKDDPARWPAGKMPQRDPRRVAADQLAPVLGLNADDLYQEFSDTDKQFIWVKRTLDPHVTDKVEAILKDQKLPGFHFQEESKRFYTKNKLAAQVLGFVGTDDVGLEGIEASMNKELKSVDEKRSSYFDAHGNRVAQQGSQLQTQARRMNTVELTIDAQMQFILEKSLDEAIAKTHAASAAAILMDPNTGEILGMASRPTFDPNVFYKGTQQEYMNRGVGIVYEPGSVFKPIIGSAGLMEGIITPNTPFNDQGSIDVGGRRIRNWTRPLPKPMRPALQPF